MNKQYLLQVQDKNNIDYLKMVGSVIHVAKLRHLIVLETDEQAALDLSSHSEVISIRESDKCQLAQ